MTLASPLALFALLSVPAIVALYLLKPQNRTLVVPSTALWRRALEELDADTPWQKLKRNLLLALQALAAVLICLALARPIAGAYAAAEWIVVMDASASMQAKDGGQTRFERAQSECRKLIEGLSPGARMTIVTAGSTARVACNRQGDRAALRQTLSALAAGDGSGDLEGALSLARAMQREIPESRIALLSDRAAGDADILAPAVGAGADNRAIAHMSASPAQGADGPAITVLCSVRNYGAAARVTVECAVDGAVFAMREVELTEDATESVVFRDVPASARVVTARLSEGDALAADDAMHLPISHAPARRALLVSAGNRFLESALSLRADVELFRATDPENVPRGYDLYVFDAVPIAQWPTDGAVVAIAPSGDVEGFTIAPYEDGGALRDAGGAAELLAHVDPAAVRVRGMRPMARDGWMPVLSIGDVPAVLVGDADGAACAAIAFDLHESNWPALKDFPIFMMNLLERLLPSSPDALGVVEVGEAVPIKALPGATGVRAAAPDGRETVLAPPFPARGVETAQIGVYEIIQDLEDGTSVTARLGARIPASESELRHPADAPKSADAAAGASSPEARDPRRGTEAAAWITIAALCILLIEWAAYWRRR